VADKVFDHTEIARSVARRIFSVCSSRPAVVVVGCRNCGLVVAVGIKKHNASTPNKQVVDAS